MAQQNLVREPVPAKAQNESPPKTPARPKKNKNKKTKVPEGKYYGRYNCPTCKAQWDSPNSLPDVPQECKGCKTTQVLPKIKPPGKKLTPYQGASKCFGSFQCTSCNKTWASGNSWADMGQECKDCRINIYPHAQRPLLRTASRNNKPHLEEYCEKCKTLGVNCSR